MDNGLQAEPDEITDLVELDAVEPGPATVFLTVLPGCLKHIACQADFPCSRPETKNPPQYFCYAKSQKKGERQENLYNHRQYPDEEYVFSDMYHSFLPLKCDCNDLPGLFRIT
ncbi:MAG: hypothetical protein Q8R88_13230 [Desulfoprunum sp.]|nr:hypothetical protein [Desulfoprunum sp.]